MYGDTGIKEVERVMGSIYLADPRADRHLISIVSYHTMNIHYLSQLFGVTRSVHDIMDRRNCVGSPTPGSIISSHPIPTTLLEPEPLFLINSLSMSREVQRSVEVGLAAFSLHYFHATASRWCISKSSLNGRGLVLLRSSSSTICGQIHRMYI